MWSGEISTASSPTACCFPEPGMQQPQLLSLPGLEKRPVGPPEVGAPCQTAAGGDRDGPAAWAMLPLSTAEPSWQVQDNSPGILWQLRLHMTGDSTPEAAAFKTTTTRRRREVGRQQRKHSPTGGLPWGLGTPLALWTGPALLELQARAKGMFPARFHFCLCHFCPLVPPAHGDPPGCSLAFRRQPSPEPRILPAATWTSPHWQPCRGVAAHVCSSPGSAVLSQPCPLLRMMTSVRGFGCLSLAAPSATTPRPAVVASGLLTRETTRPVHSGILCQPPPSQHPGVLHNPAFVVSSAAFACTAQRGWMESQSQPRAASPASCPRSCQLPRLPPGNPPASIHRERATLPTASSALGGGG